MDPVLEKVWSEKIERDSVREEFRELVNQGRKWCYHETSQGEVVLVVENFPEYFTLNYKFTRVEAMQFAANNNKLLGVDATEEMRIVNSSMIAWSQTGRRGNGRR